MPGLPVPRAPRLPSVAQMILLFADPVGYVELCRRRLGPVFRIDYPGSPPLAYVTDAAAARELFALRDDVSRAGEARAPFLTPVVGQHSLLCIEGDRWRRQRRVIAPPLHGERVATWREAIDELAAAEIGSWPLDGSVVAMQRPMQRVTLGVMLRIVLGVRDTARFERLQTLLLEMLTGLPVALFSPSLSAWLDRPGRREIPGNPLRRFTRLRAQADAEIYEEIARRRASDTSQRGDMLSLLIESRYEDGSAMSDVELRDELMTMLVAGHETTATTLAWVFERLARHPHVTARLTAELEAGEEDYLDAVVKETLRARPVVFDTPRVLSQDVELGGHRVPAGWLAAAAIPLVHRDPAQFPDPDRFDPERFLGDGAPVAGFIPFGGGARRCVGSRLALLEIRSVVTAVLRTATLAPAEPRPERRRLNGVTLNPGRRARVVLRRRTSVATSASTVAEYA